MSKPILYLKFRENEKIRGQYFVEKPRFEIGTDLKTDHFCLLDDLPRQYVLFQKRGSNFVANIPEKVTGEVVKEGSKVDLQSLKTLGFIQRKNGYFQLPIDRGQCGELQWDDLTIEFDYRHPKSNYQDIIAALERQQKAQEEKDKTAVSRVERAFLIVLMLSILIHGGLGIYAYLKDLPPIEIKSVEQVSKRFARLVLEPPKKVPAPAKPDITEKVAVGQKTQEGSPTSKKEEGDKAETGEKQKKGAKSGGDGKKAGGSQDGKKDVKSMGVLGVITASSGSGSNTAVSNLEAFGVATKMEKALGKSNQGGGGGDGTGWGEDEGFPFIASYGDDEYGDVVGESGIEERAASVALERAGDISFDEPSDVAGEGASSAFRTAAAIRKTIMSQMEGIRFCFNQSLKQKSDISGKVVLEFTILARGSVEDVSIVSSNLSEADLEACVLEVVKRWRFQPIAAGDVVVNYPLVFTPRG